MLCWNISEACSLKNRLSVFPITPPRDSTGSLRAYASSGLTPPVKGETRPDGCPYAFLGELGDPGVCLARSLVACSREGRKAFTWEVCAFVPSASFWCSHTPFLPGVRRSGGGCSPGLRLLQSLLWPLSSCSPHVPLLSVAWGKRPLTLQPTAPESPHLWCVVMLRGHRTVNSKLSRFVTPVSLELKNAERYNRPGVVKPHPDGLPDSYPGFPAKNKFFVIAGLAEARKSATRIYCPMHHWPNCLRNPSSRTLHRWL